MYESRLAEPTVSKRLFSFGNPVIGFFLTFERGIFLASSVYFLPLYLRALPDVLPVIRGVDAPFGPKFSTLRSTPTYT